MNKNFKVGQVWATRDGGRRKIMAVRPHGTWRVTSAIDGDADSVATHRPDGTAAISGESPYDLMVRVMTDQERAEAIGMQNAPVADALRGAENMAAPANFAPAPASETAHAHLKTLAKNHRKMAEEHDKTAAKYLARAEEHSQIAENLQKALALLRKQEHN